jgi:hypothetical protein
MQETLRPETQPDANSEPRNGFTEYMPAPTATYSGPIPEFSGPWAAEFRRQYVETQSDRGRKILDDEVITADEANELASAFESCLKDAGFTRVHVTLGKGFEFLPPAGMSWDQSSKLSRNCENSSDFSIAGFYSRIKGNPQNVEISVIMAQCYVRVGLRPEGYTAADYKRESEAADAAQNFENLPADQKAKAMACNDDPAHAS